MDNSYESYIIVRKSPSFMSLYESHIVVYV